MRRPRRGSGDKAVWLLGTAGLVCDVESRAQSCGPLPGGLGLDLLFEKVKSITR